MLFRLAGAVDLVFCATQTKGKEMLSLIYGIAAVSSLGLMAYLIYALCKPEQF